MPDWNQYYTGFFIRKTLHPCQTHFIHLNKTPIPVLTHDVPSMGTTHSPVSQVGTQGLSLAFSLFLTGDVGISVHLTWKNKTTEELGPQRRTNLKWIPGLPAKPKITKLL